jgi:hypothetical protein
MELIKNLTLFPCLRGEVEGSSPLAQVATLCAVFKFSLMFTGLFYILVSPVIKFILILETMCVQSMGS